MTLPIVVDPFALLGRDPGAMAALLLGDPVITFLPLIGNDEYLRDVSFTDKFPATKAAWERMSWLLTLARSKVIAGRYGESTTLDAAAWALEFAMRHEPMKPLTSRIPTSILDRSDSFVEFASQAFSEEFAPPVPFIATAVGVQAFAIRHGLTFVGPANPLQDNAGWQVEREVFAQLMPVLLKSDAEQILAARDILGDQMHPLRLAIAQVKSLATSTQDEGAVRHLVAEKITPALIEYRSAFSSRQSRFLASVGDSDKELSTGIATVCGLVLSGAPGFAAALGGLGVTAAGIGAKFWRLSKEQCEKDRCHMFGFIGRLQT